jgi:DNA repair exonuclease SbcCD ATPase subunit
LKRKDAEIARLYEQYNQPRIQIGAIRPAGAILPNRVVPPPPLPPAEMLKQRLQTIDAQIERIQAQVKDNPAAQRSLDGLKTIRARYERDLKDAEKAAPAAPPADAAAEAKAVGGQ